MEAPQAQPPRLIPFLALATVFYLIVGAIAYARSFVLESFNQKVVITSLKKEGETGGPFGSGGGNNGGNAGQGQNAASDDAASDNQAESDSPSAEDGGAADL